MIRKALENKFVFAAIVLAFALAVGLNAAYGKTATAPGSFVDLPKSAMATDPNFPPDPFGSSSGPSGSSSLAMATDPNFPPDPFGLSVALV